MEPGLISDAQERPHFKAGLRSINGPVMCLIFIQGGRLRLEKSDISHLQPEMERGLCRIIQYDIQLFREASHKEDIRLSLIFFFILLAQISNLQFLNYQHH